MYQRSSCTICATGELPTIHHGHDGGTTTSSDSSVTGSDASAPSWTVIETLTITTYASGSTPQHTTSSVSLANGVTYRLRARGTFTCTTTGTQGDAEYYDFLARNDLASGIDFGISIDDTSVDGTKSPIHWGTYSSSHVYEVEYVGKGLPIVAVLYDSQYNNNIGLLKLDIYALQ